MRVFITTLVAAALSGLVLSAQTPGDATKGKTTYTERKCGTCHRTTDADQTGGKLATVLGDTAGKLSDADIRKWLTDPAAMEKSLPKKPPMPMSAYLKSLNPPLSQTEISNLVAYVRTLAPKAGPEPASR